jgi:hypothetical protein
VLLQEGLKGVAQIWLLLLLRRRRLRLLLWRRLLGGLLCSLLSQHT